MISNDSITAIHYTFYTMKSLAAVMLTANVMLMKLQCQTRHTSWYNYQADEAAGKMDSI